MRKLSVSEKIQEYLDRMDKNKKSSFAEDIQQQEEVYARIRSGVSTPEGGIPVQTLGPRRSATVTETPVTPEEATAPEAPTGYVGGLEPQYQPFYTQTARVRYRPSNAIETENGGDIEKSEASEKNNAAKSKKLSYSDYIEEERARMAKKMADKDLWNQLKADYSRPYKPMDDTFTWSSGNSVVSEEELSAARIVYTDLYGPKEQEPEEEFVEPEVDEEEEVIINITELADKYALIELTSTNSDFTIEGNEEQYEEVLNKHINIIKSFKRNKNGE